MAARIYLPILFMLAGCGHHRQVYVTPVGIQVEIKDGVDVDMPTVLSWIDLRLEEWIRNKIAWGCEAFTDDELSYLAKSKRIIIFPGYFLPENPQAMGFTYYDTPETHVTINWPPLYLNSDLYNGSGIGIVPFDYSYGLRQLPHEWTHTARGSWHP